MASTLRTARRPCDPFARMSVCSPLPFLGPSSGRSSSWKGHPKAVLPLRWERTPKQTSCSYSQSKAPCRSPKVQSCFSPRFIPVDAAGVGRVERGFSTDAPSSLLRRPCRLQRGSQPLAFLSAEVRRFPNWHPKLLGHFFLRPLGRLSTLEVSLSPATGFLCSSVCQCPPWAGP